MVLYLFFFFSSRRRHTRFDCDWSSDVCSSDLGEIAADRHARHAVAEARERRGDVPAGELRDLALRRQATEQHGDVLTPVPPPCRPSPHLAFALLRLSSATLVTAAAASSPSAHP